MNQALAVYKAAGHVLGQGAVINNLGNAYMGLGLYRRARRLYQEVVDVARRTGANRYITTWNLIQLEADTGHLEAARATWTITWSQCHAIGLAAAKPYVTFVQGQFALRRGQATQALPHFARAMRQLSAGNVEGRMLFLTEAARAHLEAGDPAAALAATRRACKLHRAAGWLSVSRHRAQ